jgi:hypothetical protein
LTLREPGYLLTVASADNQERSTCRAGTRVLAGEVQQLAELVLAACPRQSVRERSEFIHRAAARPTA